MGSRVRGTPSASCCGSQTIAWCWCNGNRHCPKLSRTLASHRQSDPSRVQGWDPCRERRKRWGSVLYGPIMGICIGTLFSEIAAPIVMFPPRWPGTSTVALWPSGWWYFDRAFCVSLGWSQPHPCRWSCAVVHLIPVPLYTISRRHKMSFMNYMHFHFGQDTVTSNVYSTYCIYFSTAIQ